MRVLTVFGTRPEAIKLAPLCRAFDDAPDIVHAACVTGQHRTMLDQVLAVFGIKPDFDLDIMKPGQDLGYITSAVLEGIQRTIDEFQPDWIMVQGDTTTAFAAALAGYYRQVAVAHVEAGLRTGNLLSPWPEEGNRRLIAQVTRKHFAPTGMSADNLLREGFALDSVLVTGNTVIDALQMVVARIDGDADLRGDLDAKFAFLDRSRRTILVTGHRRENFGGGLERSCHALARLADRDDVQIVFPVHLNPVVQQAVRDTLGGTRNVHLIEPQEYLPFVYLMHRCDIIVTDSGGIQEEAPSLGRPVVVTRDTTERMEAVRAGAAVLVGTDSERLFDAVTELLDDPDAYARMSRVANPFGDGRASDRIVRALKGESVKPFMPHDPAPADSAR